MAFRPTSPPTRVLSDYGSITDPTTVAWLGQAVHHWCDAFDLAEDFALEPAWRAKVVSGLGELVAALVDATPGLEHEHQLHVLHGLLRQAWKSPIRNGFRRNCPPLARLHLHTASVHFHDGVTVFSRFNDARRALAALEAALQQLNFARGYVVRGRDADDGGAAQALESECQALEDDCRMQRAVVESLNMKVAADRVLEAAVNTEDSIKVELAWVAADDYRQAVLLSQELNVEVEAEAFSGMGRIFNVVFHDHDRAARFFNHSIALALTLHPRNLAGVPWYDAATKFMQEWQRRKAATLDSEHEREVAQFREELRAELDALYAARDAGLDALLKHIYAKHPPKDKKATLGSLEGAARKKTCLAALRHYHPDKQLQTTDLAARRWYFLAEEITKAINHVYEWKCDV